MVGMNFSVDNCTWMDMTTIPTHPSTGSFHHLSLQNTPSKGSSQLLKVVELSVF